MMDMVDVPAGGFVMGENERDKFANDTERPRHRMTLCAFRLARHPVTVGEYREFRPGHEEGAPPEWPVAMVSWDDANAFCEWLGGTFRLPSEAEWEYAARAGSESPFAWGETISPAQANYLYAEDGRKVGRGARTRVGTYPPNAFGLADMSGNVCEWVADAWHPDYSGAPIDGTPWVGGPRDARRVVRGGAWDYMPRLLRVSWRDGLARHVRRDNTGFRVAASL
jgi:formylglycine-generating enzyme required for sulfatase activity